MPAAYPLEPDRATQQRWIEILTRFLLDEAAQFAAAPAMGALGADGERIAQRVSRPIPEDPIDTGIEGVAGILKEAATASLNTVGPGYLAYVPGGGLYASALADLASGILNRFTGLAPAAPALVRLEADVLAWLAREFGYGPEARGLLTSGGSLANFSAIVAARHAAFGDSGDFSRAVAYSSTQAHRSVSKAVRLAGVPLANLRELAVDSRYRMLPEALAEAVRKDRAAGLRPFLVVAAAGTTNTGAIDPLPAVADLCAAEGLWLHIDGAYGAAFVLCDEGRRALEGIQRADSIVLDPHKGMFLPYGTGCLLVKDGARLRAAHDADADYLQDLQAASAPSPGVYGPELSRPYRGLRVWLPLMLHGARAFRDALSEKLLLARELDAALRGVEGIEVVDPPQLSTVAFRPRRRSGEPLAEWNARGAALLAAVNARQRVHLSSTLLAVSDGSAFTIRACILSFRTHRDRVLACVEDVRAAV